MGSNLVSSHENLLLGNLPHGGYKLFSITNKSLLDSVCRPSGSNSQRQSSAALSLETPSECHFSGRILIAPPVYNVTLDNHSISRHPFQIPEKGRPSQWARALHQTEGVTPAEPSVTAGTCQPGYFFTMPRRMAKSVS
jgi:hypothetical protein